MNRKELIDLVAAAHPKASKADVASIVAAAFAGISDTVQSGERVSIFEFGTFSPKTTRARVSVNPVTRAKVQVPAKSTIRFVPSSGLIKSSEA